LICGEKRGYIELYYNNVISHSSDSRQMSRQMAVIWNWDWNGRT